MSLQRRLQLVANNCEDEWMKSALKVAFATTDMKHVDQHFGAAKSFAIYAVAPDKISFIEAAEFGQLAMDGNEDKLAAKITILEDCIAVYSQAVGASAVNQLLAKGVQPVKVSANAEIEDLLSSLQEELIQGPSSWLAKAIASSIPADSSRFDSMEAEGWEE